MQLCESRKVEPLGSARPLTARSVIASTLLGSHPPRLPSRLLVRSGELFGIAEGAIRTAISRMVAAGELEAVGSAYQLAGGLLGRQTLQDESRRPTGGRWDGRWELAVVGGTSRPSAARAALRAAMRRLKLAELREGVWTRPDNLDPGRAPHDRAVVDAQCHPFRATAERDAARLAADLWDLDGWAAEATALRTAMARVAPRLDAGDGTALRDGFLVSAAVLRHLLADPALPPELVPARWPGAHLRADYEHFDAAFQNVWREWFRAS